MPSRAGEAKSFTLLRKPRLIPGCIMNRHLHFVALLFVLLAIGADEPKKADPIVTQHEIKLGDRVLKYSVTTGMMPIQSSTGEVEANIFYMAYVREGTTESSKRPLMFSFNGGPGSASVWLHLGALGPKRVEMPAGATIPVPPYRLVDNQETWLDSTDLVFIDPVGTGYSRAVKPELTKKFLGLRGDIDSVGEFIRMYLTRNDRWVSPLYMVGESYGTTRAAGLAGSLIEKGIAFNGVILVSSILNFQTTDSGKGNDLPYLLYLPTYTATAWYHKQLTPDHQADLLKTLNEVETWANKEYVSILARGDTLTEAEHKAAAAKLALYTGLDAQFISNSRLRVGPSAFRKELLRELDKTVGRLDSRFLGHDPSAATASPGFDPSMAAIRPAYTATFNDYVRRELGYKTDVPYYILGEGVGSWDYGPAGKGYADTSDSLRIAFDQNPAMRLFVASGYYDLATPYFATEYTLAHLGIDPSLSKQITIEEYQSGHMMYIHGPSLEKLKRDVAKFVGGVNP